MNTEKYANMLNMRELDSPEKRFHPFQVLSQLRQDTPIRYDDARNCWDVFTYEDTQRILKDSKTFSSARGDGAGQNILFMDPPKHKQMRDLVSKAFTPKSIQELAPRIQLITEHLLDQVTGDEINITDSFATPLPVIVIAELLGAPQEDREHFKRWSDVLVESADDLTDEAFQRAKAKRIQALQELSMYFKEILDTRAKHPKDDLITDLIQAEIEGEKLSDQDIISFCILLLAAGNETTTNLITNGVRVLTEIPSLQNEIYRNPNRVPGFIEEVLRYYPPIIAIGRKAAEDTRIGDHRIKAGEQLVTWVGAGNRDAGKFSDPDTFNLGRKPNPHLTFGFGIHFCLGAPLARLEGKIAFQTLLDQYAMLKRVPSKPLVPIQSTFVFGVKNYPVSFERR